MRPSVFDVEPEEPSDNCPEPGIYEGVPDHVYRAWDAVNHSRLCTIDKSPLHYKLNRGIDSTPALQLGTLIHCGRLQADLLAQKFVVMPQFELDEANTTKDGERTSSASTSYVKNAKKAFEASANENKQSIVTAAEFAKYRGAMEALGTCPDFVRDAESGRRELSIVWHDHRTGLRCKARIDIACTDKLIDLKTKDEKADQSPLPVAFEWAIAGYSYHSQAAFYADGWEALTGKRLPFWFAVVTTSEPFQCIFAPLGETSLGVGRDKNIERLSKVLYCKLSNTWAGYESPELFELPDKYLPQEVAL
jgi:exodeoxyribonuclease VIII